MAEVQLLRRQLEETSASKRQLAEALREERARGGALQARLAAAAAAAEREAAAHAQAAAAAGASAAAARADQAEQVEQLAAQVGCTLGSRWMHGRRGLAGRSASRPACRTPWRACQPRAVPSVGRRTRSPLFLAVKVKRPSPHPAPPRAGGRPGGAV